MSRQFFLIKLNSDHSEYTDLDWENLINHIKNHDGKDIFWSTHRSLGCPRDPLARIPKSIAISCDSFRSVLAIGEIDKLIRRETSHEQKA